MRRTDASGGGLLARIPDEQRHEDARQLCAMMAEITGEARRCGEPALSVSVRTTIGTPAVKGDSPLAGSVRRHHLAPSTWSASSRIGIGRAGAWDRTRAVRGACTSSASMMSTKTCCATASIVRYRS
jgi:hypothetical protein